jgi:hypothetical protein
MSQVNITLNTNTVDVNTTNNQIVVTDPTNPNVVNITQPVTSVVEVITAGPQGPQGPVGPGANINTGSFATTGSNSFNGDQTISGSLSQGLGIVASGSYSHAEGSITQAIGDYSHAEGDNTQSTGNYSHAEGQEAVSSGDYSHAEGYLTEAIGQSSHAEGSTTSANGDYSHAEGANTSAIGYSSHAEGDNTQAIGNSSHAEGNTTETGIQTAFSTVKNTGVVNGIVRLDDGYGDVTGNFTPGGYLYLYDEEMNASYGYASFLIRVVYFTGTYTIIELADTSVNTSEAYVGDLNYLSSNGSFGGDVTIPGYNAHSEGDSTKAIGPNSHAEGNSTYALLSYSHAEGTSTLAIGYSSHAEGSTTQAIGQSSHAEGRGTEALGDYSHAEGYNTIASGLYSHAEGTLTTASGDYSHAEGEGTRALANSSHAEGLYTIASARRQHVQGMFNITSSAEGAFIVGNGNADNNRSNLIFAAGNSVQITGSLTVSGSNTFTNIGPAVFSGSINVTQGISGSFSGSGANLNSIPASAITGLSSTQIATGSVTASVSTGTGSFQITSGSTSLMFISSSGNTGIGTSTPDSYYAKKLVVSAVDESGITLAGTSTSATNYVAFADGTTGNQAYRGYVAYKHLTDQLAFGSSGILRATIDSSGNFGIGTSTISARQHIVGSGTTSATTAFLVQNSTPSTLFSILDNGNVGIGTATPSASLQIVNTTIASGSLSGSLLDMSQTWNVSGSGLVTGIKYNVTDTLSNASSLLVDLQIGGTSQFKVSKAGLTTANGQFTSNNGVINLGSSNVAVYSSTGGAASSAGRTLYLRTNLGTTADNGVYVRSATNLNIATGTQTGITVLDTIAYTVGTGSYNSISLQPTISSSVAASGSIIRGVYVNPTFNTTVGDFRAIETTAGNVLFQSGSTPLLFVSQSGNVGIGIATPSASAQLQIDSTIRGFLPPRMTNAQRTAIVSSSIGLMVYCTDATEGLYVYKSTGWTFIG